MKLGQAMHKYLQLLWNPQHESGNHVVRKIISQKEHCDTVPLVPDTVLKAKQHFLRKLKGYLEGVKILLLRS